MVHSFVLRLFCFSQFGYKQKELRHPIRKPQPELPASNYSTVRNGRSPENFVKKNRDSIGRGASDSTQGTKLAPNTVTLTQDQLNSILASVGRLNSSGADSELQLIIGSCLVCTNALLLIVIERERNVLFNDTLNTFYLRLYGVRHMVKDHSDSEKGNLLPPHRLLLSINSKGSFICTIPQTG